MSEIGSVNELLNNLENHVQQFLFTFFYFGTGLRKKLTEGTYFMLTGLSLSCFLLGMSYSFVAYVLFNPEE